MSLFLYIYIMFIGTHIIEFNGNLHQLIRVFRERDNFPIDDAKEYYNCDTVLKKDNVLHFCRLIQEAQVITETDEPIQLVDTE